MRSAWVRVTNTFGFWQKQPTRADELRLVVIEQDPPRPFIVFDDYDLAVIGMYEDPAETEARLGECRHGCNGAEVVSGHESDVCDWQCHPGLVMDPERAARFDQIMTEFEQ